MKPLISTAVQVMTSSNFPKGLRNMLWICPDKIQYSSCRKNQCGSRQVRDSRALTNILKDSCKKAVVEGLLHRYDRGFVVSSRTLSEGNRAEGICWTEEVDYIFLWDSFNLFRILQVSPTDGGKLAKFEIYIKKFIMSHFNNQSHLNCVS